MSPSVHVPVHTHRSLYTSPPIHIAVHTHHRLYTSPSIHVTAHTYHRPYTSQSLHVTVSTCHRLYMSPPLHPTVRTCHRLYTSPSVLQGAVAQLHTLTFTSHLALYTSFHLDLILRFHIYVLSSRPLNYRTGEPRLPTIEESRSGSYGYLRQACSNDRQRPRQQQDRRGNKQNQARLRQLDT